MSANPINLDPLTEEKTFCYRHPTVETALRCNNCGKYICAKCAQRTPVGYRCPDCMRKQQDNFFNINEAGYVIAGAVSFALAIPTVYILSRLGLFFIIILGIPAGGIISEAVHRAIQRQRGRYTWIVVGVGVALGGLASTLPSLLPMLRAGVLVPEILLYPAIVTAVCAVIAGARFRYGK